MVYVVVIVGCKRITAGGEIKGESADRRLVANVYAQGESADRRLVADGYACAALPFAALLRSLRIGCMCCWELLMLLAH